MDILIQEVGMRDGLQQERAIAPTDTKILWIKKLIAAGVRRIQIGSFVHPTKMPQMADTDELFKFFNRPGEKPPEVELSGLALNARGVERAIAVGAERICVGVSASETHSRKNTGMSPAEAIKNIIELAGQAARAGAKVQGAVQSAFGCGFEGRIDERRVIELAGEYLAAGIKSISLADTSGHANPKSVERLFGAIRKLDDDAELVCHFHNTYGMGLANAKAAIDSGVTVFETAFGGLGGCPFTKVAAGNLATEDFALFAAEMGYSTGVSLEGLIDLAKAASEFFGRELPGFVYKTGPIIK
ncbi:MAG: hydroxymethylglutaryl-CoA lyase [Chloroflexota bacterium]